MNAEWHLTHSVWLSSYPLGQEAVTTEISSSWYSIFKGGHLLQLSFSSFPLFLWALYLLCPPNYSVAVLGPFFLTTQSLCISKICGYTPLKTFKLLQVFSQPHAPYCLAQYRDPPLIERSPSSCWTLQLQQRCIHPTIAMLLFSGKN